MIKVENSIIINKPIAEVFAYTKKFSNSAEWQVGVVSVKTQEKEAKVGAQYTEVRKFLGRDMETTLEVTALEPNKLFAAKTIKGPVPYEVSVTYEAANGGTKMTTIVQGEVGGFFKLASAAVSSQLEKSLQESSQRLKSILEG